MLTLERARSPECLLLECLSGSRAYGTDVPGSDVDLRGVFVAPRGHFFGLSVPEQIAADGQDEIYYEVGRYVELLLRNNPTVLELLFADAESTRHRHPWCDLIQPHWVVSRLCLHTFAGYALAQVKKARGLNKKIVNPQPGNRRSPLEFCHVVEGQGSVPLADWLSARGVRQIECGLVKIPHLRDAYALFLDRSGTLGYRGFFSPDEDATEPRLSSVPKGAEPIGWMQYNSDAFQRHCREHREYHEWVALRNPDRYEQNVEHGRNYDSKNLMHTFRLLDMAEEIALTGRFRVRRPNRGELLRIRRGEFGYEELMARAEAKLAEIEELFSRSDLPEKPDREALEGALVEIRERWYLEGQGPVPR